MLSSVALGERLAASGSVSGILDDYRRYRAIFPAVGEKITSSQCLFGALVYNVTVSLKG